MIVRFRMRIALVYDACYPFVKGGVEKRIFLVARALAVRHEVHVFCMRYWSGHSVMRVKNVTYHGVCKPLDLYAKDRRSLLQPFLFSFFLGKSLSRERFDVVDCSNFPYVPVFICKVCTWMRGGKLVITWSEFWGDYWIKYLGIFWVIGRTIERMCLYITKNHIAVSRFTGEQLPRESMVIQNCIDMKKIATIPHSARSYDVLFFGRLIKEKNVDLLLRALVEMPQASCSIVGDGPEKEKLGVLARRLGLASRVRFFDFVKEEVLYSMVKSAKVAVLPSSREGFGIGALEALACGCPVIALKGSGVSDFIEDGVNGFLCDPSVEDLAAKMRIVLTQKGVRQKMRTAAVNTARRFDVQRIAPELEKYYQELQ